MKFLITSLLMIYVLTTGFAADQNQKTLDVKDIKLFKTYPLKTCIVSDEAFGGDMGEPLSFVYDGQEYTICCKGCIKSFAKDPQKYVKKLEENKNKSHDKKDEAQDKHKKDAHAEHDHGDHKH